MTLKKKLYKLAGYYIKCKQMKIENIDFTEKTKQLSIDFKTSHFQILYLFMIIKKHIIRKSLIQGVYFDEKIFDIPDDLKKLNEENYYKVKR